MGDLIAIDAAVCGRAARRALSRPGAGRVLASFRRSFYVEAADDTLACVGPESLGAGPLNVLCRLPDGLDWAASDLRDGVPTYSDGGRLLVAHRFVVDVRGSADWRPRRPPDWQRTTLLRAIADLARRAAEYRHDQGFAALAWGDGLSVAADGPMSRAAAAAIGPLTDWLRDAASGADDGAAPPPAAAAALIGLGPGLTPSGDDYIGGMMVAARALGRPAIADRLAGWAVALAARRTGRISAAHLACAAAGEGAAALHDVIACLCGGDATGLDPCLAGIDAIGHSSGWDALAGAVAAMSAIARQ